MILNPRIIFTARRYAASVRQSQAGIVLKQLNVRSCGDANEATQHLGTSVFRSRSQREREMGENRRLIRH